MFTPNHWVVTASVQNPQTGLAVIFAEIECESRLQAQTLLTELRDLSEQHAQLFGVAEPLFVYGGLEYCIPVPCTAE